MSCCPPSINPDYSDSGGGGGSGVQSITAGTNITITGTSTDPIINASSSNVPRPSFTIYVSPSGNDTTANGSLSLPFLTIQGAINFRNTLSADIDFEIIIFAGSYTGNINVSIGNITFTGHSNAYDFGNTTSKQVKVIGNIDVNILTAGSLGSTSVSFCNIDFTSTTSTTQSTVSQGLYFRLSNCRITGSIVNIQSTSTVYSAIYSDCYMLTTDTPSLLVSVGVDVQIIRCELFHQSAFSNPVINIQNGNSRGGTLNMQYSKVISATTSTGAKSIIRYQNTSATTGNLLSYNTLSYTSQTVDIGNDKCCIQFFQTGSTTFDLVTFNGFDCDGAQYTGGQPYCIQKRGAGAVTFNVFGGNYGGQLAHRVDPAITRTSTMILSA